MKINHLGDGTVWHEPCHIRVRKEVEDKHARQPNQELLDVPAPANPAANHFAHELLEEGSMSQFRKRAGTGQIDLLVSASQAGSAAAFEQLHRLYSGIVFRSAYYILRNHADAEDAMQDTFLRAYMGLSGFRKEAQFHSWITRISINSSLMILRKRRRRGELSVEGPSETNNNFPSPDFVDPNPGPEESYRWNQAHSALLRSIKNLPIVLRSVVEERILRERSIEGTAEILGLSLAAIKTRLFRARKRLRRAI